jgi:hypothetical protein
VTRESIDESDEVDLGEATPIDQRPKALRVRLTSEPLDGYGRWVPQSAISEDSECYSLKSGPGKLIVKRWWAVETGLVEE